AVARWLKRVDGGVDRGTLSSDHIHQWTNRGGTMTDSNGKGVKVASGKADSDVLHVERRDFTQLVPTDRPRLQSMKSFDDCYTDIVDYIIRCTHKIWDERDVGLIYTHYTHNCVAYTTLGTMYDRETHI